MLSQFVLVIHTEISFYCHKPVVIFSLMVVLSKLQNMLFVYFVQLQGIWSHWVDLQDPHSWVKCPSWLDHAEEENWNFPDSQTKRQPLASPRPCSWPCPRWWSLDLDPQSLAPRPPSLIASKLCWVGISGQRLKTIINMIFQFSSSTSDHYYYQQWWRWWHALSPNTDFVWYDPAVHFYDCSDDTIRVPDYIKLFIVKTNVLSNLRNNRML